MYIYILIFLFFLNINGFLQLLKKLDAMKDPWIHCQNVHDIFPFDNLTLVEKKCCTVNTGRNSWIGIGFLPNPQ